MVMICPYCICNTHAEVRSGRCMLIRNPQSWSGGADGEVEKLGHISFIEYDK
jgi:hypothetical protein